MTLQCLHAGVTVDQVVANTGFELIIPADIPVTDPPRADELEHLRQIDIDRRFL